MIKHSLFTVLLVGFLLFTGAFNSAHALDPMRLGIRTGLPRKIETVGQAAQYFADAIGYRLVTHFPAPAESGALANERINPLAIKNDVKPVEEAILDLLRPGCLLVIDHEHKLFSFENRGDAR